MEGVSVFRLSDRDRMDSTSLRGISCDEDGVFLAGDIPIISPVDGGKGARVYRVRYFGEINFLLSAALGHGVDLSDRTSQLHLVARYMTEGKWTLAKIAAVQLRWPDLPDDIAVKRLRSAQAILAGIDEACDCGCNSRRRETGKRDVSNEPRVPAGQAGGGEWESSNGGNMPTSTKNPYLIPVQAIPMPIPIPAPFEFPLPPTEISPFLDIPNTNLLRPPLVNPYPRKKKCATEWDKAYDFCEDKEANGQLGPDASGSGWGGFGQDFESCVLGQVSEECGGRGTKA